MNSNNKESNYPESEIHKMTIKIMERYQILDSALAKELAIDLYKNGIKLDKFQEKYYRGLFDLDEIVLYLLEKRIRTKKIIQFQPHTLNEHSNINNKEKIYQENNSSKIISYQLRAEQLNLKKNKHSSHSKK